MKWTCSLLTAALLLAGCGGGSEVVVYTSADEHVARPIFERFERETGIHVAAKYDSEATKTTGLASLLRNESSRPRADVFWSNEQMAVVALATEGLLVPSADPAITAWPSKWRAQDGRWCALAGRARVIVYAPSRVSQPPVLWTDLIDPQWNNRIAMADPRFGTTRGHLGAMKVFWDTNAMPGYFEAWAEGLMENNPRMLTSGNAGVVDAVARGEADIGLTDSDDVLAAQARGMAVEMVLPRHARDPKRAGGGTLFIPNTIGVVAGAPHPELAARFVAFMLTAQTERQLAHMTAKHAPIASPVEEGDFVVPDPLDVDASAAAAASEGAVNQLMRVRELPERKPATRPALEEAN
jgi:iron(III) transport system substrate-binding protein